MSDNIKNIFDEYKEWKSKRFILFKENSLLTYRPSYVLLRPHLAIAEIARRIKWAYQRVVRGWDDTAVWGVDVWLNDMMPDILMKLKEDKQGIPMKYFDGMEHDGSHGYTEEQHEIAKKLWNKEIDKMIDGFLAAKKLNSLEYNYKDKKQEDELTKMFEDGMNSFRDNYFSLWD